ncbi:uncharacterized protein Z518_03918 [Rhinocladiella mackenziei CBS 650.93]|uniref:Rhinocladiella mackenziei CBS 650.93 unplaced genomic scaffold supercont1.3, whole genome shotgun sequence n=1 Tax=Rhinocladiella mackenziei CBS 650.93 TaxID=1442369 RepID=A0A0D2IJR1_9EURO|nr:uncharacterized protein Z518_03918 [Rhinocladiella mackenziei CBS 650.93]KIX05944.1 hypothetical protein Z518_03918 [Rhinocladiella mackenziei CBS 650.93]
MSTSSTSRAQVLFGPKNLRLIDRPIDLPGPGEVQVQIKSTPLCGSDLHYFSHYANGDIIIREPLTQGHETAGIIVALGTEVDHLKVGGRVALEVGVPCEKCFHCQDGRYNVCPDLRFRSSAASYPHFQGTLQEKVNHPARWCHRIPDSMSFDDGALLEPLSVAIHAFRKADIRSGSPVLIIGAGVVGLLCAAVARHRGCRRIVAADIAPGRLEFAQTNGFVDAQYTIVPKRGKDLKEDLAISKETAANLIALSEGSGYDAVFECTGVEASVRTSIYACRPSGDVLLVGMGTPIQTLPVSAAAFCEVNLKGIWRYADTYPTALKIMESIEQQYLKADARKLITHKFKGLESVPDAFALAARTQDEEGNLVIKVVVQN